jgi:hypothetical protein
MNCKRFLLIVPLLAVAVLSTTPGAYYGPAVNAQETKTDTTTGYPTGTKCPKSGTYRASNKYLEIIIVVAAGEIFPPFSDGSKTIWYPLKSTTKDS